MKSVADQIKEIRDLDVSAAEKNPEGIAQTLAFYERILRRAKEREASQIGRDMLENTGLDQ